MIFLKEFAIEKTEYKVKLMNAFEKIFSHLLKVYYYPRSQYKPHWVKEIYSFLNDAPILKSTKKLPKEKLIFDSLWTSVKEIIPRRHRKTLAIINEKYGDELGKVEYDAKAESFVYNYVVWISENLSKKGDVLISEVEAEINSLLRDYKRI